MIMAAVLGGLVWWGYQYNFGFPDGISEQSAITLHFWNGTWIAAFGVGILTWGLMLFASVAYRRRRGDDTPKQLRYNIPIEVLYTVTPIAMVLALVFFTVRDEAQLTKVSNDQAETVNVTGFRWSWTFYYADQDVYDTGIPSLQDEAALPVLWLPVDEKVQFHLGSPDVIHSFWVPDFLFKLDVIPGRDNVFEVTPNEVGTFAGKCAELCGVDHSRMLFNVKVVERAEFDQHMAELKAKGQTGDPDSGRVNDAAQGV
ncbi:MAG: cytochrome c oxidase subunit II [Actinobacteria bacterium]|nr:MAG: cytochrome c oxidase subunit II [Actinomycetota bacterium]